MRDWDDSTRSQLTVTQHARLDVLEREVPGFRIVGWDPHRYGPILQWPNGATRTMKPNGNLWGQGGGELVDPKRGRRRK